MPGNAARAVPPHTTSGWVNGTELRPQRARAWGELGNYEGRKPLSPHDNCWSFSLPKSSFGMIPLLVYLSDLCSTFPLKRSQTSTKSLGVLFCRQENQMHSHGNSHEKQLKNLPATPQAWVASRPRKCEFKILITNGEL